MEKNFPDESLNFSLFLYELLPRIKLTDLLMEVANWTNFHEQFIHASSNHAARNGAYQENDLHPGLPFERGPAEKNPSGLNKGEAMNALARAIFFCKHGELRERELQDQLQRASALNIIINAISVWNTYVSQFITTAESTGS